MRSGALRLESCASTGPPKWAASAWTFRILEPLAPVRRALEVDPGFVDFEVGSSPERLTWDAPRTAKSEEEDPGCKTLTRPPRPSRPPPIATGCGWSRPASWG